MTTTQLHTRKDNFAQTRVVFLPDVPLLDGQVRVRIDQFAYTANNITYAAFGEAMHYWQFFPLIGDANGGTVADAQTWGVIPAWGFAVVVQSRCPAVAVGERLYGYWPTASHAVLSPKRLNPQGFMDGASHRAELHPLYNQYVRCAADPLYTPETEGLQALLRPLFLTAWLIDDFLADNGFFGTTATGRRGVMLLSSASSKTACATAAQLAHRADVEVVGLTSPGNVAFCESLGIYSQVLTYGQLDHLAADTPCVYVDFAGSGPLRQAIHTRFGQLAYDCAIGGTHVAELGGGRHLPGPRPVLFFAPAQAKKRHADWGAAEFNARMAQAWRAHITRVQAPDAPWLVVERHAGALAVQTAHAQVLCGTADPRAGHILSFQVSDQNAPG